MSGNESKNKDVKWFELKEPIKGLKTDTVQEIRIEREIIPIIFIPGIMGSRLRSKDGRIWDPDGKFFMFWNYGMFWNSAADRKSKIIGDKGFTPDYLEADNENESHNKTFFKRDDRTRGKRGWGGIMWSAYGKFIDKLQSYKWPDPLNLCFEFPVHAFGYNWTDTNRNSGKKLKDYIEETIEKYKSGEHTLDKKPRMCHRVIIVTHSMGGIVARSACLLHGMEEKILGVIHGVQPASGAPDAYWRMKGGTRRADSPQDDGWSWLAVNPLKMAGHKIEGTPEAWVLGTDGEEITATLGNMPGGLELLPTKKYKDNEKNHAWLNYPTKGGGEIRLPNGDPYQEIYRLNDGQPYRMINPDWLDPGKKQEKSNDENKPLKNKAWGQYIKCLQTAETFHDDLDKLAKPFHPETYQFYVSGIKSVDRIEFTRKDFGGMSGLKEYAPLYHTMRNRGACDIYANSIDKAVDGVGEASYIITLEPPSGAGDGTVPDSSGKWLKLPQGRTAKLTPQSTREWIDLHHQPVYAVDKVMEIVTACIWNFAQKRIDIGEIKE